MIQPTRWAFLVPAAKRAPKAAYVPAPPIIVVSVPLPFVNSISSTCSQSLSRPQREEPTLPMMNMPNVQNANPNAMAAKSRK